MDEALVELEEALAVPEPPEPVAALEEVLVVPAPPEPAELVATPEEVLVVPTPPMPPELAVTVEEEVAVAAPPALAEELVAELDSPWTMTVDAHDATTAPAIKNLNNPRNLAPVIMRAAR